MVETYQRLKLFPAWLRNKKEEEHNPFGACLQDLETSHKALPLHNSTTFQQHPLGIRLLILSAWLGHAARKLQQSLSASEA